MCCNLSVFDTQEFAELPTCVCSGSHHVQLAVKSAGTPDPQSQEQGREGSALTGLQFGPPWSLGVEAVWPPGIPGCVWHIHLRSPSLKPAGVEAPTSTPLAGVRKARKCWNVAFSHPIVPRCCKPLEDRASGFDLVSRSFFTTEGWV